MSSIKHYQELQGSNTDDVRVSAPVYAANDLFKGAVPRASFLNIDFTVASISSTGLTLAVPDGLCVTEIRTAQTLELKQGNETFFECKVVIAGGTQDKGELRVLFDERGIDINQIARKNSMALARTKATSKKPAVTYKVPMEYKVYCTEVLDYIADQRQFIETHIAPYEDGLSEVETRELCVQLEESSTPGWSDIWFRGNELVLPFIDDVKAKKDLKTFTERLVTRELVGGRNWHRSYFKPMGYPGDFQIMNYMYDHQPEGTSIYSRYLHILGLISGRPIVSRMEYISEALDRLNQQEDKNDLYHVMSIGSGPAREVQRFLETTYQSGEGYSFTLVDQEIQALDYAITSAYRSLTPSQSNVIVSGMHTSFTEMLRPMSTFRHIPQQHLIYSAGLLDYLNPGLSRRLCAKLYDYLRPGGTLLIGNVNDASNGTYWPMEFILDWTLYFRSRQQMLDMAGGCKGAEVDVDMDESGAVYMLKITKPE